MIRLKYRVIYVALLAVALVPLPSQAVIPPDFIFNIGGQIAQFFSIIMIFITAAFGAFFNFFKTRFYTIKHKKIVVTGIVLGSIITALAASYAYATYRQNVEYQQWLEDSEEFSATPVVQDIISEDANDLLQISEMTASNVDTSNKPFISTIEITDNIAQFIVDYYSYIATGDLEAAYAVSKKTVDYETFASWYNEVDKITLDKLVRIDDATSSLELTLYEGDLITRYGVLMALQVEDGIPRGVEKSEVKILEQVHVEDSIVTADPEVLGEEYIFFEENTGADLVLSNENFQSILNTEDENYIVIDARENIEYDNGHFPDSTHIRFADLKAGRWIELPKDKYIYVICWSGIRGKEVAEFLRTKKLVASYLENGASGWVDYGGVWDGGINFSDTYSDKKYQTVFTTDDVYNKVESGIALVDTRQPSAFDQWHISGSVNIPTMYTASIDIEKTFEQLSPHSTVITVCDDYVNCFDAKLTGIELERRGHTFLGRYNRPWEYEK